MPSDSFRSGDKLIWVVEKWIEYAAHPFSVLGILVVSLLLFWVGTKALSDNDDLWQVSMTSAKHIFWAKASIQSMMIEPFLFLKLLRLLFLCGIAPTRRCNQSFRMQQKNLKLVTQQRLTETWTSLSFQKTWAFIEIKKSVLSLATKDLTQQKLVWNASCVRILWLEMLFLFYMMGLL